MTPTQRSLAYLRGLGEKAEVVEKWLRQTPRKDGSTPKARHGIRRDLFEFIDIVSVGSTITGVQTTSTGIAERIAKIQELEAESGVPSRWLRAGGVIEIHGWAKRRSQAKNADGKRSKRMEARMRRVVLSLDAEGKLTSSEV